MAAERDTVLAYRLEMFDMLCGIAALGVLAQIAATIMVGGRIDVAAAVAIVSTGMILLVRWVSTRFGPKLFYPALLAAGVHDGIGAVLPQ